MKQFEETMGVDVSKLTLDACLHQKQVLYKVENNKKGFSSLVKWAETTTGVKANKVLWCFEHTGLYSLSLATFLSAKNIPFVMVPALEIKRSIGLTRGKNDKIDARRIAQYAYLRRDKIKPTILPSKMILNLKELVGLREKMVVQRAGYKSSLKELRQFFTSSHNTDLFTIQQQMIRVLDKNIASINVKILALIKSEAKTQRLYELITSIVGVGPIVAVSLIVTTNCFLGFESSRQYACYCGVAPFEYQSGKSLRSRARVSKLANKRMKALLDRAANSAARHDPELRSYYQRRVNNGKSKMATLNAVRNKIIHRIFAVVKRGTPYVKTHLFAA